jgi:hypothetical protein
MRGVPSGSSPTSVVETSSVVPVPSGTTSGRVKRTEYSASAPGSPAHVVITRPVSPIVSIPCAMTPGSPAATANPSSQWIGFGSPAATA